MISNPPAFIYIHCWIRSTSDNGTQEQKLLMIAFILYPRVNNEFGFDKTLPFSNVILLDL